MNADVVRGVPAVVEGGRGTLAALPGVELRTEGVAGYSKPVGIGAAS